MEIELKQMLENADAKELDSLLRDNMKFDLPEGVLGRIQNKIESNTGLDLSKGTEERKSVFASRKMCAAAAACVIVVIVSGALIVHNWNDGNSLNPSEQGTSDTGKKEITLRPLEEADNIFLATGEATRRYIPLDYPRLQNAPTSLPVYKTAFMESSYEYLIKIADVLEIDLVEISSKEVIIFPGIDDFKASRAELSNSYYDDCMFAYSNGAFKIYCTTDCARAFVPFVSDLYGISYAENDSKNKIIDDISSFVLQYNEIFNMNDIEISIAEDAVSRESIDILITEKKDDVNSDSGKIKLFNALKKKILIKCSYGGSFYLEYTTDTYYEDAYVTEMITWEDGAQMIKYGNGILAKSLTRRHLWRSSDYQELLTKKNDIIVETTPIVIYVHDEDGYYRPVYLYEKECEIEEERKSGIYYRNIHYYEFIDPVVSVREKSE